MKQTLQLKLSQHLALTPQLQLSIRLLQLSTLELNQEIEQFLHENPLLERDEPEEAAAPFVPSMEQTAPAPAPAEPAERNEQPTADFDAASEPSWGNDAPGNHGPRDDDDSDYADIQTAATSLGDHLGAQLALTPFSDHDRSLVAFLIEALDDSGYLGQSLEDLVGVLAEGGGEAEREELLEELQIALKLLQNFDPPGIGARSPSECLALQLSGRPADPVRDLALAIVKSHLDLLAARDFTKLKKLLRCDDDALRAAHTLIRSLDPRPGARYSTLDTRYIIPDVVVKKQRGGWTASLNPDAMPRLHINRLYAGILQRSRGGGGSGAGLASQLQEAKWLIKNVQQRFDTILRVAQAIVDRQRQFLEHGEVAMRPLTLREIADTLGLHESTISRVTTQKFMASPRGIFELKYFFGSHVATEAGGEASSTAIRALIKQLVAAEDGHKPLSDAKITEILGQQGIVVARRTIAKYRDALNIPPVNLRKIL
ncbi:RNA polymerase sigma-54 factor [mine drainage metagenome]|uniref:RNA polymerase sigma-54 factor n=1 Tax=mine drainage metagenome TaxID=410659 RepID=A0A1J5S6J5_9ZZZZ